MPEHGQIRELFNKYMQGSIAADEYTQLCEWIDQYSNAELEQVLEPIAMSYREDNNFNSSDWEREIQFILTHPPEQKAKVITANWKRISIAASVIFLLGFAAYFLFFNKAGSPLTTHDSRLASQDVAAPQTNHATITLADGKKIFLDSTNNGQLATQNNVSIIKTEDGKITYQPIANGYQLSASYNTLTNPRGSKVIDMTLADGSRVWLNAGSSITYPVAFMNNERKVSITGEAYFEVKHNDKMPFRVTNTSLPSGGSGWAVDDIGTSFNINAYDDEDAIRVTLLEGSIKVSRLTSPDSQLLTPGQQAILATHDSRFTTNGSPDLDQVIAWKNDKFIFSGSTIQSVMRQLARWYDVDVSYEGNIPTDEFVGVISRSRHENISAILDMLQRTKTVSFHMEGRKITVAEYGK